MGRTDILKLGKVCTEMLNVNFTELCLFSLFSTVNKTESFNEKIENTLQKIITLTAENLPECQAVVEKMI